MPLKLFIVSANHCGEGGGDDVNVLVVAEDWQSALDLGTRIMVRDEVVPNSIFTEQFPWRVVQIGSFSGDEKSLDAVPMRLAGPWLQWFGCPGSCKHWHFDSDGCLLEDTD